MFDKIKQIAQMKGIGDEIQKEEAVIEKNGLKIVVKGDFTIKEISLSPNLNKEDQEKLIKDCFNQATKDLQMRLAKRMMGMNF